MRALPLFFLLLATSTGMAYDYDAVFVGTSPISLFEALYQSHLGRKVLILEKSNLCGGAWKSIDICGIEHVDFGCHQIGFDLNLKTFLEVYGGCKMVSLDDPRESSIGPNNGYYFSEGCYELIRNLLHRIETTDIVLLCNRKIESVSIDLKEDLIAIKTDGPQFSAKKLFYTHMSSFQIENAPVPYPSHAPKFPHLYLLIQDPTEPKFSYIDYEKLGASRAMNLTYFVGLAHTGRQLLVFQVDEEEYLRLGEDYLEILKKDKLVDPSAYILEQNSCTYEAVHEHHEELQPEWLPYLEEIDTASFMSMSQYTEKWKQVLPPYDSLER